VKKPPQFTNTRKKTEENKTKQSKAKKTFSFVCTHSSPTKKKKNSFTKRREEHNLEDLSIVFVHELDKL